MRSLLADIFSEDQRGKGLVVHALTKYAAREIKLMGILSLERRKEMVELVSMAYLGNQSRKGEGEKASAGREGRYTCPGME